MGSEQFQGLPQDTKDSVSPSHTVGLELFKNTSDDDIPLELSPSHAVGLELKKLIAVAFTED